jgi:hypothetical protein
LGATVPNSPDLSHLLARLDRLEADNADLREQLDVPPTTTRRNLLRGATVAAGAAGLGLLSARPAAAANPGVFLNQDNPGTSLTTISGGTNSGPLKVVGNVGAYGVRGQCNGSSGYAVYGETDLGYAVVGDSTSGVDLLARGNGILSQQANNRPGPPTSGAHDNGEMTRDKSGGMWLCTADGTPGTWRRVVALPPGAQGGAYVALDHPIRLLDTRPGKTANNAGVGIRTNGSTRHARQRLHRRSRDQPDRCDRLRQRLQPHHRHRRLRHLGLTSSDCAPTRQIHSPTASRCR